MPPCRPLAAGRPGALDDLLAVVQQRVPYLRAATEADPAAGWLRGDRLIADPELLRATIDGTAAGRGTDDPQVAASLFAQAYAFRVPSLAVAAFALDRPGPSVDPADTAVRIARHRPAELAITAPALVHRSAEQLATAVLVGHLAPFVAAVRAATRIGERLLWGDVAASIASTFRAVQAGAGPLGDPAVRARADAFWRVAAPWFEGLGHWSTIDVPGACGWWWDRSSCCLWYRSAGGPYCEDCSLVDAAERAERRRAELLQAAAGATS